MEYVVTLADNDTPVRLGGQVFWYTAAHAWAAIHRHGLVGTHVVRDVDSGRQVLP